MHVEVQGCSDPPGEMNEAPVLTFRWTLDLLDEVAKLVECGLAVANGHLTLPPQLIINEIQLERLAFFQRLFHCVK